MHRDPHGPFKELPWQIAGILVLATVAWSQGFGWAPDDRDAQAFDQGVGFCVIDDAVKLGQRAGESGSAGGVQLLVDQQEAEAGVVVKARFANFSSRAAISGARFQIQRYGREGWSADTSSPKGPWLLRGLKIKPGDTGECYRYLIPDDQPAGRYRFRTKLRIESREKVETAAFKVR